MPSKIFLKKKLKSIWLDHSKVYDCLVLIFIRLIMGKELTVWHDWHIYNQPQHINISLCFFVHFLDFICSLTEVEPLFWPIYLPTLMWRGLSTRDMCEELTKYWNMQALNKYHERWFWKLEKELMCAVTIKCISSTISTLELHPPAAGDYTTTTTVSQSGSGFRRDLVKCGKLL